jgi:hypothetical protein
MGIVDGVPGQFDKGALVPLPAYRRTSEEKIEAVLRCRTNGMTQKRNVGYLGHLLDELDGYPGWSKPLY